MNTARYLISAMLVKQHLGSDWETAEVWSNIKHSAVGRIYDQAVLIFSS